jgi:Ribbon-helix-helix protein, copG family
MEAGTAPPPTGPLTIQLPPAEAEALRQLAAWRGMSRELVLREALLEKKFFADNRRAGREVVLRNPANNQYAPVNWTYEYPA